ERGDREPARELADDDRERLGPIERRTRGGLESVLAQDLPQVLRLALVTGDEPRPEALRAPTLELGLQPVEAAVERSEEHTSELQSPDHLVCRLLLEKKKTARQQSVTRRTDTQS